MTCLGTTLEFPEVAADILQQTNFSLELPPGNRRAALTLLGWSSRSSGRSTLYIESGGESSLGMCITAVSFIAGAQHNWIPLSLFLLPLSLTPSDDLKYKISSLVPFISRSYEISQI